MPTPPRSKTNDRDLADVVALVARLDPAIEQQNRRELVEVIGKLVELRAPLGPQWQRLAYLADEKGETGLAREAIDLYVAAREGEPAALYEKAGFLAHTGDWQEAYGLLRKLPANVPDDAANAYSRGTTALYLGRADEARAELERATSLQPKLAAAWQLLGMVVDYARAPDLADRLISAGREMENAPPADHAIYSYALGRAYADLGEHRQAFAAFEGAARQLKPFVPYKREHDRATAAIAARGYSSERIGALAAMQHEPTDRCMFVTGLPRSGTTLVEQILTSHSAVSDGGEIDRLRLLAGDVGGLSYDAASAYVHRHGAAAAAHLWGRWLDQRFPAPGRVVDKTVNTTRLLGLVATLLPDAPLIWLTRDPLDCAWSCFRTFFNNSMPWSNDLEDIAYHFRLENELLEQWQEILRDRLLVVPFEELASDPDPWIRRIVAHCALAEEPSVFAPHENARVVTTSSAMQVRRPINRAGIGVAEPYREFLAPFINRYYG